MNSKDYRDSAREVFNTNGKWYIIVTTIVVGVVTAASFIFSILIIGPALVGLSFFYLNSYRNRKSNIEDVLKPGTTNYVKTLLVGIVKPVLLALWTLLLIVPGIIKSFSYAMTEYIVADNPDLDVLDAITKSRELMDGNKFKLFKLHLSFIGWYILVFLTFGILGIYVIPYIKLAETAFYLDLINDASLVHTKNEVEVIDEYEIRFD